MSNPSSVSKTTASDVDAASPESESATQEPQASYVKLAMRNMVRKRSTSLFHFFLTTVGLLTVLIGLAYLTR